MRGRLDGCTFINSGDFECAIGSGVAARRIRNPKRKLHGTSYRAINPVPYPYLHRLLARLRTDKLPLDQDVTLELSSVMRDV